MKKIHVVRRDQFDEKRISLYKRHSLSSLKEYIDCKAGEITYISTQSFKNISWGEDTIIFEDIALLEAIYSQEAIHAIRQRKVYI